MSELTPNLLQTHVADVVGQSPDHESSIGVFYEGQWHGPEQIVIAGRVWPVVHAECVLGARAALARAEGPIVLLTSLDRRELGRDVLARLLNHRVYFVNPWTLLLGRFEARALDPRLDEVAVAEALIEATPPGGFEAAPGGVLDEDTAWKALARHVLRLDLDDGRGPDVGLLGWALDGDTPRRFRALSERVRERFSGWLTRAFDGGREGLAALIAALLARAEPAGAWLLLVDAAADAPERTRGIVQALVRQQTGGVQPGVRAETRLADALSTLAEDDAGAHLLAQRGDELDRTFAAQGEVLGHSRFGNVGHRRRLEALVEALDGDPPVWDAAEAVRRHHRSTAAHGQAALALARLHAWLQHHPIPAPGLMPSAMDYLAAGCWVDRARAVADGGEFPGPVHAAVERFLERVVERREQENLSFARSLAAWTQTPSLLPELRPIEEVLERVVVPLAADVPVLLLVLDGLPLSIAHVLVEQMTGRDFQVVEAPDRSRAIVSTVPSRTEWARASLFAGDRRSGGQHVERRAFSQHPGLTKACERNHPPVLFHAGQMKDRAEVEAKVADARWRVVGVVLNAVDDELMGSTQYVHRWRLENIRGLLPLLQAARDAGRAVVLASDHGHVRHGGHTRTRRQEPSDGGQRWSLPRAIEAGEVDVSGQRVAAFVDGGRVVVPGVEGLRYVSGKPATGYHGGATPQEILAPLFVLWPSRIFGSGKGRDPISQKPEPPAFWHRTRPGVADVASAAPPVVPLNAEQAKANELPLFAATASTTPRASWSGALRASPQFAARSKRGLKLPAKAVDGLLDELAEHGGRLSLARLSSVLSMSEARVRMLASSLQRILNVDGYAILSIDRAEEAVLLDLSLLRSQFELDEP